MHASVHTVARVGSLVVCSFGCVVVFIATSIFSTCRFESKAGRFVCKILDCYIRRLLEFFLKTSNCQSTNWPKHSDHDRIGKTKNS